MPQLIRSRSRRTDYLAKDPEPFDFISLEKGVVAIRPNLVFEISFPDGQVSGFACSTQVQSFPFLLRRLLLSFVQTDLDDWVAKINTQIQSFGSVSISKPTGVSLNLRADFGSQPKSASNRALTPVRRPAGKDLLVRVAFKEQVEALAPFKSVKLFPLEPPNVVAADFVKHIHSQLGAAMPPEAYRLHIAGGEMIPPDIPIEETRYVAACAANGERPELVLAPTPDTIDGLHLLERNVAVEADVAQLIDMGFSKARAIDALKVRFCSLRYSSHAVRSGKKPSRRLSI